MAKTLKENIAAFEAQAEAEELETHHQGKFALIYDGEFVDAFDTFHNAAVQAVDRFGKGPYLIRQIGAGPVRLPASVMLHRVA